MNNFTNYDLVQACMSGNLELAKSLLEQKPTIDICDEKAFVEACRYGHLELAKWLLEQKTTIDISANNDEAFVSACSNGSLEVAKWLQSLYPEKYYINSRCNNLVSYKIIKKQGKNQ